MKRTTLPCAAALFVALAAAAPCQSRVLPETLPRPEVSVTTAPPVDG